MANVVVEPPSGRFCDRGSRSGPAPVLASLTVPTTRPPGITAARERADLDVVHLPPPGEEALVVEARPDVRRARPRRTCRRSGVPGPGRSLVRRPDVRPASRRRRCSRPRWRRDRNRSRRSMKSLAHWIAALVRPERSIGGVTQRRVVDGELRFAAAVDDRVRTRAAGAVAVELAARIAARVDLPAHARERLARVQPGGNHAGVEALGERERPDEGCRRRIPARCRSAPRPGSSWRRPLGAGAPAGR